MAHGHRGTYGLVNGHGQWGGAYQHPSPASLRLVSPRVLAMFRATKRLNPSWNFKPQAIVKALILLNEDTT